MVILLFCLLIVSYEIYYMGNLPVKFHFPLLVFKVGVLFLCTVYSLLFLKLGKMTLKGLDVYILLFYLFCIFMSSIYAISSLYVLIYGTMFFSLQLFLFCLAKNIFMNDNYKILKVISVIFTLIIIVSVLGSFLSFPNFAYVDVWGSKRVQGLYVEPGKLAQISALNIIFTYFLFKQKVLKLIVISLCFLSLFLAGNRSYMIAIVLIMYALFLINFKVARPIKAVVSVILICAITLPVMLIDKSELSKFSYLRLHSLLSLSGRINVWRETLPIALIKPLGSGYCLGGTVIVEAFEKDKALVKKSKQFDMIATRKGVKTTLHNGYLQTLADLGPVGFFLYLMIFVRGITFAIKGAHSRYRNEMGIFICIFVFFTIVNLSATAMISPTDTNTVLFWLSWFVLMINYNSSSSESRAQSKID